MLKECEAEQIITIMRLWFHQLLSNIKYYLISGWWLMDRLLLFYCIHCSDKNLSFAGGKLGDHARLNNCKIKKKLKSSSMKIFFDQSS